MENLPLDPMDYAQNGEFPWTIALFSRGSFFGGGSLIAPGVVLTAAHLLLSKTSHEIVVRAGEWDMASVDEPQRHQERRVVRVARHEDFQYKTGANDIALLYLDSPFELKDDIQSICLPLQGAFIDQTHCLVSGWGKRFFNDSQVSSIQKKVELPIVNRGDCQNMLRKTRLGARFQLASSLICAGGEKDKDVCNGDGGSALVCSPDVIFARFQQVGIVAWGVGCGRPNVPTTYTNVSMFREWI
ncbi:phenoloxidase-activating factor 2 [Drosophila simulans]|uniref:Phenoloxidase-activating factor 2 n=1 Tax=Drosophila simulans TaxID=7240 RepID=A0A0J9R7V3_DROSI|nr:phenoloxidase-activating factor 2 [Drosophila simulans]KMY92217.1 uncharacterized protein Dsimw501_GD10182 [Drosophila simulans]